jgi:hypothetical protein
MVFTACNKGSGTQQQTASAEQTQTDAKPSLQTLTEDLFAFVENESEKNNNNDLFMFNYTEENPVKIWGWSKNGKVGISELEDAGGRGGIIVRVFVLDVVTDTILWEQKIDSFDFDDGYSGIPENELDAFFGNFQNVCRQQFGINLQEGRLSIPSNTVMRHNGKVFNVIIDADIEIDKLIRRYFVIVETDDKRKTILSTDTFLLNLPIFYRYNISPFEERTLIIGRWWGMSHSFGFIYAGCHLTERFRWRYKEILT